MESIVALVNLKDHQEKKPVAIDRGVPLPSETRGAKAIYPFRDMQLGDSFLLPATVKYPTQVCTTGNLRHSPKRFTCRKTAEGYRIWRIA